MTSFKASAAPSTYLISCGITIVTGVCSAFEILHSNAWRDLFLCFVGGGLLIVWHGGFRIVVADGRLRYRNGFYRWRECQLADIESVRIGWIGWGDLKSGEKIVKVPRLIINTRRGDRILIRRELFKQDDLNRLLEILHPAVSPQTSGD